MKNFSEFLAEAYNFRLGGSQKKGFDQNVDAKLFNELEAGDKVYVYDEEKSDKISCCEVVTVSDGRYLSIRYKIDGYDWSWDIEESKKDEIIDVFNDRYIFSTSENAIREYLGSLSAVKESYSFRLGGSQKKGFNQNKKKTIAELKRGDIFYAVAADVVNERTTFMHKVGSIGETKYCNEVCISITEDEWHSSWTFPKRYSDEETFVWTDPTYDANIIVSTDLDDFLHSLKENNIKDKFIDLFRKKAKEKLDESYNFRLGGSQKKGFDQNKSFADLEPGDMFYAWGYTNSPSVDKTVAEEYTVVSTESLKNFLNINFHDKNWGDFRVQIPIEDIDASFYENDDLTKVYSTSFEELQTRIESEWKFNIKRFVHKC